MKCIWPLGALLVLLMNVPASGHAAPPDASLVDSTQVYYAKQDVPALQRLLRRADSRELKLLCRYRLYPLTQNPAYLADLPDDLPEPTARELALLSGLWGYRVLLAPIYKVPTYGKRATRLLDQARTLDPEEPFVLLIGGQSLLFRPKIFGGNKQEALAEFEKLCRVLPRRSASGISPLEADLWVWYTRDKMKDDGAEALRSELLTQNPPPLYRTFLLDPP